MGKQLTKQQKTEIAEESAKMQGSRTSISAKLSIRYGVNPQTIRNYMDQPGGRQCKNTPFTDKEMNRIRAAYEKSTEESKSKKIEQVALKFKRSLNAVRRIINTGVNENAGKEKMFNYKAPFA